MDLLAFVFVSAAVIIVPGPNVLVIISTSIDQGILRGLQTVAGTSLAMATQLGLAALGTSSLVLALSQGLVWLKWTGVVYLCYLGVRQLISMRHSEPAPISAYGSFQRGFWVSLTNPKTILFFAAFLPQFVLSGSPYLPQVVLLSAIFLAMAVLLDSGYALLAGNLAGLVKAQGLLRFQRGFSGLLYLGAGAALAASKKQ